MTFRDTVALLIFLLDANGIGHGFSELSQVQMLYFILKMDEVLQKETGKIFVLPGCAVGQGRGVAVAVAVAAAEAVSDPVTQGRLRLLYRAVDWQDNARTVNPELPEISLVSAFLHRTVIPHFPARHQC